MAANSKSPDPRTLAPDPAVVLVAEDEPGVLTLVVSTLSQAGYRVLAAVDGVHALALAAQYPSRIDLLLSDVMMPNLNGPGLARQLTAIRPEVRVLFMTGSTADVLGRMGIPFSVLHKPFTIAELIGTVREVLESSPRVKSEE